LICTIVKIAFQKKKTLVAFEPFGWLLAFAKKKAG
jgi:hypothetical protein